MAKYKGDFPKEEEVAKLSWAEAPKIITKIPGPKTKEIFDKEMANETPTRIGANAFQHVWSEALGATVKDPDGNLFIDLTAGVAVNNVGHTHPKVVEVIKRECELLMHVPDMSTPWRQKLGEKLSQIAPGKLKGNVRMAYGLSGSSAVEMALKLSGAITGRTHIIALEGAYHGSIGTALTLTGSPAYRVNYRPFMPFVYRANPYAYCYRCPLNLKYPACDVQCAKFIEFQLTGTYSGVDVEDVAALIIEPVQAEGGYVPPPPRFLEHLRQLCQRLGILFIADEVQVGLGRTGKMFAVEHYGIEPDLITMGKALGGDLPFSGVMVRKDLAEKLLPMSHVLTAAGNNMGCAVACTNIDLLLDGLVDRAAVLGDYLIACLKDMQKEREMIGDVRGKGLGIAIELVKNRQTREPLGRDEMGRVMWALRDKGVLLLPAGRFGNVLRVIPPLVITKPHADKALEIISQVLKEVEGDILTK